MSENTDLDQLCINTIRFLAVDAVQKAESGHPGTPLGAAAVIYTLWNRFLRHDPGTPDWFNRDRFILSPGHASALLYSMLHLTGYNLPLEEVKNFRQWNSKTPGHPEYGLTAGVEATTGPLGQGFSMALGMSLVEKWLSDNFNDDEMKIIDHYTYALASDGDLQEGISAEAASLAGTWKLGKLICLYDDNDMQIEGPTDTVFTEDVAKRFDAYGWQVIEPVDGFSIREIQQAIRAAQQEQHKPSLIICRTIIGYGSPDQNTAKVHGAPLGTKNVAAAKRELGWPEDKHFYVPDEVYSHMRKVLERGQKQRNEWEELFESYSRRRPNRAHKLESYIKKTFPGDWESSLSDISKEFDGPVATRSASGITLNRLAGKIENLIGGSADLGPSNKTVLKNYGHFGSDQERANNVHFGVREHAMAAIANGAALHGGCIPYVATFLTFSDYMRPAMRLAAMMKQQVIYVFTHDSIGLGEDGPTHQPVEHLMSLRSVPNLTVIRPADAFETAEAWKAAVKNSTGPTALVLSRQKLPLIQTANGRVQENLHRGAYIVSQTDEDSDPDIILIGTGSELHTAVQAAQKLSQKGINVRTISMPSWEIFDRQTRKYRDKILPPDMEMRISVEAGITTGWEHYVGLKGASIGLDHFGASAPYKRLYEEFDITPERVVAVAERLPAK